VLVVLLVSPRLDEVLHLHLLELTGAEDEVARSDLVAERLAGLRNAERELAAHRCLDLDKVHEDPLSGLGTQPHHVFVALQGPDVGLEHQVEVARIGELVAAAVGTVALYVVGPVAGIAVHALHQRIGEHLEMARRFPRLRMKNHRGIEADDVVPELHHRAPPGAFDVLFHLNAQGAIVPSGTKTAVNFCRLIDKAPSLGKVDDRIE
jgi:hypothetical protein